jgi:hypothetical protein
MGHQAIVPTGLHMKKFILALGVCGALGAASSAAEATTMVATWTGTIAANSSDTTGVFGLGTGNVLAGQTFTLTTTFNTTAGSETNHPGFDKLVGGGSAVLTINNHSVAISGSDTSDTYYLARSNTAPGQLSELNQAIYDSGSNFNFATVDVSSNNGNGGLLSQITTPISLMSLCPSTYSCSGRFSVADFSSPTKLAAGDFDFTSGTLQIAQLAAAPIPAALPLFVSALGGLGFVGWRRRRQAVA